MYLKKTWRFGNRIDVRKYHSMRTYRSANRGERIKPTPEQVKRNNEKMAIKKLTRLMIGNFTSDDWHVVLTYDAASRPDPETAKAYLQRFIRKMRDYYKKSGAKFKWIAVTEYHSHAIHHHLVMNGIEGIGKLLQKMWPHGGKHMTPLYENRDFQGLAEYFVKETKKTFDDPANPFRQRYTCSRNLEHPVERTEVVNASSWREEPTVPDRLREQGYVLDKDSVETGFDSFGFPFQEYSFIRYAAPGRDGWRKK